MALEQKNYDPALMAGANLGVQIDLTDITDMNNNEVIEIDGVTDAVNYLGVQNAATGGNPTLYAGGEADTGITFENSEGEEIVIMEAVATAVNEVTVTNAATSSNPSIAVTGGDTNISLQLTAKGTGLNLIGDTSTATIVAGSATINAQRGKLTIKALATTVQGSETFTLLNNKIGVNSNIQMTLEDPATNGVTAGLPVLGAYKIESSGSCVITIVNPAATAVAGTAVVNFVVLS